jgi:hypothetical protein
MGETRIENLQKALLLIVAIGLIPIALSYGLMPIESLDYLYNIQVSDINVIHIMRAVMGLYLALIVFWLMGVFKPHIRKAALYSLIVFMFGLAAGRILSLIIEGIPNWLLLVYLFLEVGFGFLGLVLLKKSK